MQKIFHLASAQEVSAELLDAIKATFKSQPIKIIVEEDDGEDEFTADMKATLENRLQEDESTYLTAEESIRQLNKRYGV